MENFSWDKVLLTVFGGGGLITVLIGLLTLFFQRFDLIKKKKAEQRELHDSLSIENRKLDLTEGERNKIELEKILLFYQRRVEALETKLSNQETAVDSAYDEIKQVRRAVSRLNFMIFEKKDGTQLSAQIELIENGLDELEKKLP